MESSSSSSDSSRESSASSYQQRFEVDPKINASFRDGIQALQDLFSGVIQTFQDSIGEEWSKNASAAAWLSQVVVCLQEIEQSWATGDFEQPSKLGELSCFLDRMTREIEGSRIAYQAEALQLRVTQILQMLQQKRCDATLLREVLGYLQVALKSMGESSKP